MIYNFYEVYEAEWEAMREYEAQCYMDTDYEESCGHLWD